MDQNYSLFALIFKGVHEPFGGFILDGVYKPKTWSSTRRIYEKKRVMEKIALR